MKKSVAILCSCVFVSFGNIVSRVVVQMIRSTNIYNVARDRLVTAMGQAVANAFKLLLSEKHLYQSVEVDMDIVSATATGIKEVLEAECREVGVMSISADPDEVVAVASEAIETEIWVPDPITQTSYQISADSIPIGFSLPTINTCCDNCKARWPFNPVLEGSYLLQGLGQDEFFYLGYQCQQCKGEPIRFLVRREGLKLRLAGRYPLEVLPTPKVLPQLVSKYYGNAVIAHHAGQTLAGLFLLRVFIEQFWRTIPAVKELIGKQEKATGDEQGNAYQETLPTDFKSRFPSLTDIYDKLSAAIHSADENAALFDDSCRQIQKHFDARRLFEIS
jgi:hypothetical protein